MLHLWKLIIGILDKEKQRTMLRKVKLRAGRIGWIERYINHDIVIVRFADGWGWINKSLILEYVD